MTMTGRGTEKRTLSTACWLCWAMTTMTRMNSIPSPPGAVWCLSGGSFTVASSNRMFSTISVDLRDHEVAILDFSQTDYMDDSAAFVVERLVDVAIEEDTECIVMGLGGAVGASLEKLHILRSIPKDRYVDNMDEARVIAKRILGL